MPVCEDAEACARAPRLMDVDTETCSIALQHGSLEETAWSPACAGMTVGGGEAPAVANCALVGDDRLLEFVCGIAARPDS